MHTGDRPRELKLVSRRPDALRRLGDQPALRPRPGVRVSGAVVVLVHRGDVRPAGGVGWCYEIICRLFPDGGGVYSSAKQRSQLLAVVGGLLLCADYVVTASLSCLDAFHYLGVQEYRFFGFGLDAVLAAATILAHRRPELFRADEDRHDRDVHRVGDDGVDAGGRHLLHPASELGTTGVAALDTGS